MNPTLMTPRHPNRSTTITEVLRTSTTTYYYLSTKYFEVLQYFEVRSTTTSVRSSRDGDNRDPFHYTERVPLHPRHSKIRGRYERTMVIVHASRFDSFFFSRTAIIVMCK